MQYAPTSIITVAWSNPPSDLRKSHADFKRYFASAHGYSPGIGG